MSSNYLIGNHSPYFVYSSYDKVGSELKELFVRRYGEYNVVDIFEYPDIVTERGLAHVTRSPSLVFLNRQKPNTVGLEKWTVMDIPSQIRNELLR